jgi:hypothetical protein
VVDVCRLEVGVVDYSEYRHERCGFCDGGQARQKIGGRGYKKEA